MRPSTSILPSSMCMVILLWLVALLVLKNCNKRGFYLPLFVSFLFSNKIDKNHKAFKDPLHIPVGLITKARSKKIKEALNGLIQEIWADSNTWHSKLDPKEDEGVINLIQTIEGWSALIGRDLWRGLMADWLSNPILVNSHFSYSETYYFRPNPS